MGDRVSVYSAGTEDSGLKDSRSDGASENRLNDDRADLSMIFKIE